MIRRNTACNLLFLAVLLTAGCAPVDESSPPADDQARVRETLVVGLAGLGDLNTLDPARAGVAVPILVVWQTHERLVDISPNGEVVPMLATKWISDDDLMTWRFQLRTDAVFHSAPGKPGKNVSSADVKASVERALRIPGFAQTLLGDLVVGAEDLIAGKADSLAGIEASEAEIVFRLSRPFAFLPERLAASFLSIVPAETPVEPTDPPFGSGPYRLANWDRNNNRVKLEKVDNRAGSSTASASSPRSVVFHVFANEGVAVEELLAGTLDWLETTSTALPLLKGRATSDITISSPLQTTIRMVALNMTRPPFESNPEVAQALNAATNREEIVKLLGAGAPIIGPIPHLQTQGIGFDAARASDMVQRLPEEAQRLKLLVQPGGEGRLIAEIVQRQWTEAGFEVVLQPGQADFFPRVINGDYQMALGYYGPFVPSAEQYLWPYRTAAQPVPNVMRFSATAFDNSFNSFTSGMAETEREGHLSLALDILIANPPAVWLFQVPQVVVTPAALTAPRTASMPVIYKIENNTKDAK